jgi:hypothetical protein
MQNHLPAISSAAAELLVLTMVFQYTEYVVK